MRPSWPAWPRIDPPDQNAAPTSWWHRLMWMGILWAGSVGALLVVASALRWVLRPA